MSACSEFFALAINCRASPMEVEKRQANEGLALTCCQQKVAHRLWGRRNGRLPNGLRGSSGQRRFPWLNGGGAG